ncbi:MAG: mechanosensitive ion channel, partial [Planctomycetaceae bacterium]
MFSSLQSLWDTFLQFSPKLALGAGMFLGFWIGGQLLNQFLLRVSRLKQLDDSLTTFLGRAAKTTMVVFGAVTALGTIGVDVGALIAALGLTGFAIGLAFKDIVSNALSGILI